MSTTSPRSSGGEPEPTDQPTRSTGWALAVGGTAAILIALRGFYLAFPNLFPEEAYYWNYAKHLDYGYLDHPPMVAWLIQLGTIVFGDTEPGVRIFAFVSSLIATFFAYRLTTLFAGRAAGWIAVLLMQTLPIFCLTGFMMTPDAPLTACWSAALYFLAVVFFERRTSAWWGVGVALGFGLLSKYTIALLGPAALLFILLDRESRFWLRHVAPYGAAVLAALIFSPVIVWNAVHHWASFAFQSAGRVREPKRFSLHELMGAVLLLLTPLGAVAAGFALSGRGRGKAVASGLTDPPMAGGRAARQLLFARVFALVPLSVFVAFSLIHRVKLNWTGPLWLAVVPLIAAEIAAIFHDDHRRWARRGWVATFAVCGVGYLVLLQHLSFGVPGLRYSTNIDLLPAGWSKFGAEIERQAAALRNTVPADVPVRIVGMDRNFIASETAFYHSHAAQAAHETLGANLFDKPALMYAYWFPAREQNDAALLLVAFDRSSLEKGRVGELAHPRGGIQTHTLEWHGQKLRSYYTLEALDYHYAPAGKP